MSNLRMALAQGEGERRELQLTLEAAQVGLCVPYGMYGRVGRPAFLHRRLAVLRAKHDDRGNWSRRRAKSARYGTRWRRRRRGRRCVHVYVYGLIIGAIDSDSQLAGCVIRNSTTTTTNYPNSHAH